MFAKVITSIIFFAVFLMTAQVGTAEEGAQTSAGPEGFFIGTTDGKFKLGLHGLFQADGRFLCRHATSAR
jgi:hypothetical protein